MTTKEELDRHLAEIRKQREDAQKKLNHYQAKVKKLGLVEKIFSIGTGAIQSGKAESILRYFAQED